MGSIKALCVSASIIFSPSVFGSSFSNYVEYTSNYGDVAKKWLVLYNDASKGYGDIYRYEKAGLRSGIPLQFNLSRCFNYKIKKSAIVKRDFISSVTSNLNGSIEKVIKHGANIVPINLISASKFWPDNITSINLEAQCGCNGDIINDWVVVEDTEPSTCKSGDHVMLDVKGFIRLRYGTYRWLSQSEKKDMISHVFNGLKRQYLSVLLKNYNDWIKDNHSLSMGLDIIKSVPPNRHNLLKSMITEAGGVSEFSTYLSYKNRKPRLYGNPIADRNLKIKSSKPDRSVFESSFSTNIVEYVTNATGLLKKYKKNSLSDVNISKFPLSSGMFSSKGSIYNQFGGRIVVYAKHEEYKIIQWGVPDFACKNFISQQFNNYDKWEVNGVPVLNADVSSVLCSNGQNKIFFTKSDY